MPCLKGCHPLILLCTVTTGDYHNHTNCAGHRLQFWQPHTVHIKMSCCECFHQTHITPVWVYLCGYFANLIGQKQTEKKTARRKVKSAYSGEAPTSDEIISRLEDEDRKRKEKAAATNKKRAEKAAAAERK